MTLIYTHAYGIISHIKPQSSVKVRFATYQVAVTAIMLLADMDIDLACVIVRQVDARPDSQYDC
ncbi:hypothetical protein HYFRA_00012732 [Hymenoscyphus fraxineus]|uniref:Uncharacterized protein n=1 Tax=Hymenoscyphus fraxineus TaxID=746836 RepID=A0A9N9PMZ6_9HELO|nr:hypothetical protein HYFRA_00012732 [Hymenoscyphus fraxineus]